jgi:hypothetical protein
MFWDQYRYIIRGQADTPLAQDVKYEKLPIEEDDNDLAEKESLSEKEPTRRFPKFIVLKKNIRSIGLAAVVSVVSVLVLAALIVVRENITNSRPSSWTNCGSTPDEARRNGCFYEPMQRAWIPPECYFEEPIADYDVFRDRSWYSDANLTIPSNIERLESGDEFLAYTRYWHDEHCTYVFRKLAIAVENRKFMVNSRLVNIHHSNHCARMIAKRIVNSYNASFLEYDETITESYLAYENCVELPWKA